ncbi:MAG TPA: CaiB/BaiF CoA-transferase family protein [Bryobacteraceae bacterium]|nr:CaiB/BaiF CoA-transferase family protein [Bryobacteraceae bacterium]
MSTLPFSGLRVVALEQAVAAPFCSRQLADLGADVVKIERPDGGDFARSYDSAVNGLSAYFVWLNRGKRSVALDIKSERGREACAKLLDRADVFLHNLVPGAVERLGLGYEELSTRNPRLIWCGISGYGPDGPYRDKKAYDLLVQAESGVVSLTGTPDAPAKVGVSIADITSGFYAYSSILAALFARERTGIGDRIDISMLECLTEWMMPPMYVWMGTGDAPPRNGLRHNMIAPYGAYPCSDGVILFGIQNQREWQRLCPDVLGLPNLATDSRFAINADRVRNYRELDATIESRLSTIPRAEVLSRLEAVGIPNASLNSTADAANHPQLAARHRWTTVDSSAGPLRALFPPHNLQNAPSAMGRVPELGEHTREVLAELGMED